MVDERSRYREEKEETRTITVKQVVRNSVFKLKRKISSEELTLLERMEMPSTCLW